MNKWFFLFLLTACTDKTAGIKHLDAPDLNGMREESRKNFKLKDKSVQEVRYVKDQREILIKIISDASPESLLKAIELRQFELDRPFREERSPYPGAVTESVRCPDAFKPRIEKRENFWRAQFATSKRKLLVCNEQELEYSTVEILLYCPTRRTLFNLTAYAPKGHAWLSQFACAD